MRGRGRLGVGALAATLVALLAPSSAVAIDLFTFGNPAFCEPKKPARDFGFDRLPPVRELPPDEELPFAPPAVSVYGSASGQVLTERGGFGFGFSEANYEGTVRLGWTVTAQMWRLGGRGEPLRQIGSTSLTIGRLDAADQPSISLETGYRRGFYRFDIQFAGRDGEHLGAYSGYTRVMRPFWKPRLVLDRRVYRPGQLVLSRPENLGTEWISYGEEFAVQRRVAGRWKSAPEITPDIWALWLGTGGPGATGRCSAARLPHDVAAGRYRIVKEVGSGREGWPDDHARSSFLTAPFRVR